MVWLRLGTSKYLNFRVHWIKVEKFKKLHFWEGVAFKSIWSGQGFFFLIKNSYIYIFEFIFQRAKLNRDSYKHLIWRRKDLPLFFAKEIQPWYFFKKRAKFRSERMCRNKDVIWKCLGWWRHEEMTNSKGWDANKLCIKFLSTKISSNNY